MVTGIYGVNNLYVLNIDREQFYYTIQESLHLVTTREGVITYLHRGPYAYYLLGF